MVMDVYLSPREPGRDEIYLLELLRSDQDGIICFTSECFEHLFGVFDTLESPLYAMDHNINYDGRSFEEGHHLFVNSVLRNRARICRNHPFVKRSGNAWSFHVGFGIEDACSRQL